MATNAARLQTIMEMANKQKKVSVSLISFVFPLFELFTSEAEHTYANPRRQLKQRKKLQILDQKMLAK